MASGMDGLTTRMLPAAGLDPLAGDKAAETMTDIHDIKTVLAIGTEPVWAYWALAALIILALAFLGWRLWRRRRQPAEAVLKAPLPPPEAEAFQQLDVLAAENHVTAKVFYFRLSAILRHYVERRFDIPAAEMTTEELLPCVPRIAPNDRIAEAFKAFCRASDPVKFAHAAAGSGQMAADMAFVRQFVHQTTAIDKEKENQASDQMLTDIKT